MNEFWPGPLGAPLGEQPATAPGRVTGSAENPDAPAICSARGCRAAATWAVLWNNPTLHTPERRKLWAACDEHREHLADFLRLRGFLRDVKPLSEAT